MRNKTYERLMSAVALAAIATSAVATKVNAPGDINNFGPAVISVMSGLYVSPSRKILTSARLSGGGDLTADRTIDLSPSGVTAGTLGDATHVPQITYDTYGRITSASSVAITMPSLTGYAQLGVAQTWTATQSFAAISSSGITGPLTGNASTATALATSRTIAILTGDVTSPGAGFTGAANETAATTLAASGVTAGNYGNSSTYPTITVDAKGRVTVANSGNFSGITAGLATALATPRLIGTATGDVTSAGSNFDGSAANTNAYTLAASGVTAGACGSSSSYCVPTFDAKGRATSFTTTALGNAAFANINNSGHNLPYLDGNNVWTGTAFWSGAAVSLIDTTSAGTANLLRLSNSVFNAGAGVGISLDPRGGGVGVRDAQIQARITASGGTASIYFRIANGVAPIDAWVMGPSSSFFCASCTDPGLAGNIAATKFIGPLTGNADTATSAATLTTARTIDVLTGDVTSSGASFNGSASTTATTTLAAVGTAGTYGSATQVPVITTDAKGRVTAVTPTTITMPSLTGYVQYGVAGTFTAAQVFPSPVGISIDGASGVNRTLRGTTAGVLRWRMDYGNNVAESGSNVGSDWQLVRFDDTGTGLGTAFSITRSTGAGNFTGALTAGSFIGNLTGNVSGSSGSTTGNALTATTLQTARTVNTLTGDVTSPGASFNGSASTTDATTLATTQSGSHTWGGTQTFSNLAAFSAGINVNAGSINLTGATSTNRVLYYLTGASQRWAVYANAAAESGTSTGTNYVIQRYDNTGAAIDAPLTIDRSTGLVTLNDGLSVTGNAFASNYVVNQAAGNARILAYQTSGSARFQLFTSSAAESGSNAGSNFVIRDFADDGTTIIGDTVITRSTGGWTFPAGIGVTGAGSFTGTLTAGTLVNVTAAAGSGKGVQLQSGGVGRWNILSSSAAESGSNVGSDLTITALSDTGTGLFNPIIITRSTGMVTLGTGLTSSGSNTFANTGSNFTIGFVASTVRGVTFNNFGQSTYRYDDNSPAPTFGTLQNFAITAINQGATLGTAQFGAGGVLGAVAGSVQFLTTDTWAAAGNRSDKYRVNCIDGGVAVVCEDLDPNAGQNVFNVTVLPAVPIGMGVATFTNTAAFSPTIAQLKKTNLLTGTITAAAILTLPACIPGQDIRVTRTGAGAFNWTISPTTRTLAQNTWADFSCNTTAFVETAFGAL